MHGLRIAKIGATAVRLHWTVPAFSLLLMSYLAMAALPGADGSHALDLWLTAAVIVITLIASLGAHEFAHAIVARRHGITVDEVTMWLLGGVTTPRLHLRQSGEVMSVALAGPIANAVIGSTVLLAATTTSGLTGASLGWIGSVNLVIAGVNLVPATPFDGGEVLAERLRHRGRSDHAAAQKTADYGMVFGVALIGFGVLEAMTGILANGLMNIVFGLVARDVARAELHRLDRTNQPPSHSRALETP